MNFITFNIFFTKRDVTFGTNHTVDSPQLPNDQTADCEYVRVCMRACVRSYVRACVRERRKGGRAQSRAHMLLTAILDPQAIFNQLAEKGTNWQRMGLEYDNSFLKI